MKGRISLWFEDMKNNNPRFLRRFYKWLLAVFATSVCTACLMNCEPHENDMKETNESNFLKLKVCGLTIVVSKIGFDCHQLSLIPERSGQAHMAHFTHLSGLRSGTRQPRDMEAMHEYPNIFI